MPRGRRKKLPHDGSKIENKITGKDEEEKTVEVGDWSKNGWNIKIGKNG